MNNSSDYYHASILLQCLEYICLMWSYMYKNYIRKKISLQTIYLSSAIILINLAKPKVIEFLNMLLPIEIKFN